MPLTAIPSIPSSSFTGLNTRLDQDQAVQFDLLNKLLMDLEKIESPTLGEHAYALTLHEKSQTLADTGTGQWQRLYQELALKFLLRGAILNPENERQFDAAKDIFSIIRESNADHALIQPAHVDGYAEACIHNYAHHLIYAAQVQQSDAFDAYEIYKGIENKDAFFWRGLQKLYFAYRQLAQANKQCNSLEYLHALEARFHNLETEYEFKIPPAVFSNIDHLHSSERYLMKYDTNPKNIPN
ncbi:MAG: hypothetical protein JWQ10_2635 [Herbaspirillum sp.]|nr:hypothetical protein [Herbaspirillum sp.]